MKLYDKLKPESSNYEQKTTLFTSEHNILTVLPMVYVSEKYNIA